MKKLIDWKLYDTETSTMLLNYNNRCDYDDPNYIDESLLKTKNWDYLIYWIGGSNAGYNWEYDIQNLPPEKCVLWFEWIQKFLTEEEKDIFFNEFSEYIEIR